MLKLLNFPLVLLIRIICEGLGSRVMMKIIENSMIVLVVLSPTLIMACGAEQGTLSDRKIMADGLLAQECEIAKRMAGDYISNEMLSGALDILAEQSCGCVKDILSANMAKKYSLSELENFQEDNMDKLAAVQGLLRENKTEVRKCFNLFEHNGISSLD